MSKRGALTLLRLFYISNSYLEEEIIMAKKIVSDLDLKGKVVLERAISMYL